MTKNSSDLHLQPKQYLTFRNKHKSLRQCRQCCIYCCYCVKLFFRSLCVLELFYTELQIKRAKRRARPGRPHICFNFTSHYASHFFKRLQSSRIFIRPVSANYDSRLSTLSGNVSFDEKTLEFLFEPTKREKNPTM